MTEAKVSLLQEMQFRGEGESGYSLTMDAAPEFGGKDTGAGPMELVLIALGGCTGMDVISTLRKKRQDVTAYEVILQAENAQDYPRVFTRVRIEHVVKGRDISRAAVERAVQLSTDKYCSVIGMVRHTAKIETEIRIENVGT